MKVVQPTSKTKDVPFRYRPADMEAKMRVGTEAPDAFLKRRVHEETRAAIHSPNAKAACAHVEMAIRYLCQLNRKFENLR
jgi:hypothetical protein